MGLEQAFIPPPATWYISCGAAESRSQQNRSKIFMMTKGTPQRWMPISWSTALKKRGKHGWYTHVVKDDTEKLSHVLWMSVEQIAIAQRFPYLILHDNTYQSNRYNLLIGLFLGVNNYGQSVLMGQAIVVGEKTRDFEYQFTHWLAAVGIAPVVMFTDACVKASRAVATVFPNGKHFWCYWHIAKNVA